jgi:diguanylate cyclase (GGDEF)-like protein
MLFRRLFLASFLALALRPGIALAQSAAPEPFRLPLLQLLIGLGLLSAIAIFVVTRRRMAQAEDRRKEAIFQAHTERENARAEFDAELKDAVTRASSDDLSFVVLRRLLARIKKTLPQRSCAALVQFPDGEGDRLVCPDPRSQAEFEAIVKAYEQPLKNVSWSGNAVTLNLRVEVNRWSAQTLGVLPIPIPKPGFGILLIARDAGQTFGADELDEAGEFAQRAIDSMELARTEAEEKSDREIDKLTQVYNRAAVELRASTGFTEAVKSRTNFSVLWIELDKFRVFAKEQGQETSDMALKTVAQRISRALERGQIVGRWDNHEFVVIMPTVPEFQAQKLADSLVGIIAREIKLSNNSNALHITASIGFASKYPSDTHFTKILERASKGKDQAKYQGGNTSRRGNEEAGGVNFQSF